MTVAIPEAAASAGAGAAGSTRAGASRARARQSRPTQAQMGRSGPQGSQGRTGPRGAAGTRGRTTPGGSRVYTGGGGTRTSTARPSTRQASKSPQEARERLEGKSKGKGKGKSRRSAAAGRLTGLGTTKSGSTLHNYQAIIAAEYVAATLLVALAPIASGKQKAATSSGSLSPFGAGDIIKIFAIGIVYLILMGAAAGPRGLARFSAWFGFLIMLGVGLSELANIASVFSMLAGGGVSPTKLTGAAAPVQKGGFTIPPLVSAGPPGSSTAGTGGSGAGEGSGGPL